MEFRSAGPGDAAAIAEVHVLAWRVTLRGMIPDAYLDALSVPKRTDSWRELIGEFDPPKSGAFVALDGVQLLGFASFCPSRDPDAVFDVGEIPAIYVHPDHSGRGYGAKTSCSLPLTASRRGGIRVSDALGPRP